jgi:hypothetical protein
MPTSGSFLVPPSFPHPQTGVKSSGFRQTDRHHSHLIWLSADLRTLLGHLTLHLASSWAHGSYRGPSLPGFQEDR